MNKSLFLWLPVFTLFFMMTGNPLFMGLGQEKQAGTYRLEKRKNNSGKTLIAGRLLDLETGERLRLGAVSIDGKIVKIDTSGTFSLEVTSGKHLISGIAFPYCRVFVKPTKVTAGQTLFIEFRLLEDKTPLID